MPPTDPRPAITLIRDREGGRLVRAGVTWTEGAGRVRRQRPIGMVLVAAGAALCLAAFVFTGSYGPFGLVWLVFSLPILIAGLAMLAARPRPRQLVFTPATRLVLDLDAEGTAVVGTDAGGRHEVLASDLSEGDARALLSALRDAQRDLGLL